MDKFLAVFKREYLERVRTRGFIFLTVFGPIFFGAIMIVPALLSARATKNARLGRIELIDATQVGLGNRVMQRLIGPMSDTGTVSVREVAPEELAAAESSATAAVIAKRIAGFAVFDSATVAGRSARYAGRDASQIGEMDKLETAIRQTIVAARLEKAGLDPAQVTALTNVRLSLSAERITERGRGGTGLASTILGFAIAFLLYISIVLYGQNVLRSVIEEKTTRVSEVIVASVRTDILLAGKVLGVSAVSLTQLVVWVASSLAMYNARSSILAKLGAPAGASFSLPPVSLWMGIVLFLFFLLGFVFYFSLFAAAGATVSSDQEAQQAQQPVVLLLVSTILLMQPVLLAPTSTMAKVLSWLPFSAPIIMPMRMTVTPISSIETVFVLIGLAAASAASIWVSARIYRIGLLMYGKRPSLRELARWIRQA